MFQHNQDCAANLMQKNPEQKKIGDYVYLKNRLGLGKK